MAEYAVVFKIKELVAGNGWLAAVSAQGRALMAFEDGLWWMYGVQPGGMSVNGKTAPEAWHNFTLAFKRILSDHASETVYYENFAKDLGEFFAQIDEEDLTRWKQSRNAVRSGTVTPDEPFIGLPKDTSEALASLETKKIDNLPSLKSAYNDEAEYSAAA